MSSTGTAAVASPPSASVDDQPAAVTPVTHQHHQQQEGVKDEDDDYEDVPTPLPPLRSHRRSSSSSQLLSSSSYVLPSSPSSSTQPLLSPSAESTRHSFTSLTTSKPFVRKPQERRVSFSDNDSDGATSPSSTSSFFPQPSMRRSLTIASKPTTLVVARKRVRKLSSSSSISDSDRDSFATDSSAASASSSSPSTPGASDSPNASSTLPRPAKVVPTPLSIRTPPVQPILKNPLSPKSPTTRPGVEFSSSVTTSDSLPKSTPPAAAKQSAAMKNFFIPLYRAFFPGPDHVATGKSKRAATDSGTTTSMASLLRFDAILTFFLNNTLVLRIVSLVSFSAESIMAASRYKFVAILVAALALFPFVSSLIGAGISWFLYMIGWSWNTFLMLVAFTIYCRRGISLLFTNYRLYMGPSRAEKRAPPQSRLYVHCVNTHEMDSTGMAELFALTDSIVDVPSRTVAEKNRAIELFDLYAKSFEHVIIFRERLDGSLRGMFFMGAERNFEHQGKKITLVKAGLGLFRDDYNGGPWFLISVLLHFLKELITNPKVPVYGMIKSYSVRSYLFLVRHCQECYPHYAKETPAWHKSLMDSQARAILREGEMYDEEKMVVHREYSHLKAGIAQFTDQDRKDPHINLFAELNPGWNRGHMLVVLARVSWSDVFFTFKSVVNRALGRGSWKLRRKSVAAAAATAAAAASSSSDAAAQSNAAGTEPAPKEGDASASAATTSEASGRRQRYHRARAKSLSEAMRTRMMSVVDPFDFQFSITTEAVEVPTIHPQKPERPRRSRAGRPPLSADATKNTQFSFPGVRVTTKADASPAAAAAAADADANANAKADANANANADALRGQTPESSLNVTSSQPASTDDALAVPRAMSTISEEKESPSVSQNASTNDLLALARGEPSETGSAQNASSSSSSSSSSWGSSAPEPAPAAGDEASAARGIPGIKISHGSTYDLLQQASAEPIPDKPLNLAVRSQSEIPKKSSSRDASPERRRRSNSTDSKKLVHQLSQHE